MSLVTRSSERSQSLQNSDASRGLETLEPRLLMAGDVSVSFNNGVLRLIGDNATNFLTGDGNRVIITRQGNSFLITGEVVLEDPEDPTSDVIDVTGINGGDGLRINRNLIDRVFINLRQSNDQLLINNANGGGDWRINLSGGSDSLTVINTDFRGKLDIRTGGGFDDVTLSDVSVVKKAEVQGSNSSEDVRLTDFDARVFKAKLKRGSDLVGIYSSTTNTRYNINSGAGDDYFAVQGNFFRDNTRFNLGSGDDSFVAYNNLFGDDMELLAGRGFDFLVLDAVETDANLEILGGDSDDTIWLDDVRALGPNDIEIYAGEDDFGIFGDEDEVQTGDLTPGTIPFIRDAESREIALLDLRLSGLWATYNITLGLPISIEILDDTLITG